MSKNPNTETVDPAALAAVANGSLTVPRAVKATGLCRQRLFQLMKEGVLDWFREEGGQNRLTTRKSLQEYLARCYAARKRNTGAGART